MVEFLDPRIIPKLRPRNTDKSHKIVSPSDVVTEDTSFMRLSTILNARGHGTYLDEDNVIRSSLCGVIKIVNKLITVEPLKSR